MECRDEVFRFRTPPTDAGLPLLQSPGDTAGEETRRLCRTVHGPVQERAGGRAFARRYAIWDRELETIAGLAEVQHRALDRRTSTARWTR